MRALLVGVALLALTAPAARAQQADEPTAAAFSGQAEPGRFLVYFAFDRATLDASARRVVTMAADEYKRTGAAQVAVTGYADKAGRPAYNQRLSERRAEAVRHELERLGVPASAVQLAAEGENDHAVPTVDGVPEACNRRVVIAMPQPAPPPVAAPSDDGLAGRSVLSLGFAPDLGFVRPHLAVNVGGVYGKGGAGRVRRRPGAGPRPQPDAKRHAPAEGGLRLPAPRPELGRGHPLGRPRPRPPLLRSAGAA